MLSTGHQRADDRTIAYAVKAQGRPGCALVEWELKGEMP
jgi:hypothetical protein